MASSTPLKDIEENFFLCPVCLDQFKEPKLLPCLHRYCRDCLKTLIEASDDGTIKCPMCKAVYDIPRNGVNDIKTDFHMKSMLEFIQLQKSFENKELKKCISCSKKMTVTAYCFKCRNFLCDQCYQLHLNNPMFTDHQPHILNLENIEAKNLTLDKLSTLTEDPRCHIHVTQPAQLCCCTCENEPVCVTCFFGKHKGHDLRDVTEIAKSERESLQHKLDELSKHHIQLYQLPEKIKATKRTLTDNLSKETEKLRIQYEKQVNKIKAKHDEHTADQERQDTDIETRRKYEEDETAIKREEEINLVREKYDKIMEKVIGKYVKESEEFRKKQNEIKKELNLKLNKLECNLKNITTAQDVRAKENVNELQNILDHCEQIINKYKRFTATISSIRASNDDWTDAQCIPHIRAASEPLIKEMKKNFPELEALSNVVSRGLINVIDVVVTITEHKESVVDVDGIKATYWQINGITSSGDGNIVITGFVPSGSSHITVINRKGGIQRQDKVNTSGVATNRYCCFLSEFKVATVSISDEIGIYNIRDGSYNKKSIRDVTSRWPTGRYVKCVTTDPVNNHIIVGTNSRDMYVFDDQLNYSHTITLPDVIKTSRDVTVHRRSLLICDDISNTACAVTVEGSESKLMYEFNKPDADGDTWIPKSVCTDTNGFIYTLWYVYTSLLQQRWILVQYSQDGGQLLATRPVANTCRWVTTLVTDEGEKLFIASYHGKLYTYGLVY